jgi:hypothetical protein
MGLKIARFFSLLFVALVLAPAMAHLLELPNKIGLSREEYLVVQQIYNGWQLLGIVIYGALLSMLALTMMVRHQPRVFALTLAAFLCLLAAHALFWIYTFPANKETLYWTVLPENWMALRAQWEYSHAAGAVLNLIAFILLILSMQSKATE